MATRIPNLSQPAHSVVVEMIANSGAMGEINQVAHKLTARVDGPENKAALLALSARNLFIFASVELTRKGLTRKQALEAVRALMAELMDEAIAAFGDEDAKHG